jgi:hypothetical protein
MKKLQHLCMSGVFTLVLSTAAFGGHIETPGVTPPPPPPPDELSAITPAHVETEGIPSSQAAGDSVTDIALNLLQTMLTVF